MESNSTNAFESGIPQRDTKSDIREEQLDAQHAVNNLRKGERGRLGGPIVYGTEIIPEDADVPRIQRRGY